MNHLEPLSWTVPLLREGLAAQERELLIRQHQADLISHAVRSTFRVIATFLEGCRQWAPAAFLAGSVHGARQLGRVTYELAVDQVLIDGPRRSDWKRCLEDLDQLAIWLSGEVALPRWELVHALDSLIGLLVQLDGSIGWRIAGPQALTLNRRATVRSRARSLRQVNARVGDGSRRVANGS